MEAMQAVHSDSESETEGRGGGRPLGFADSNRRRAVASPRRIRASGNGDSGDAYTERDREGGEEERAGVRQGRRGGDPAGGGWAGSPAAPPAAGRLAYCHAGVEQELRSGREAADVPAASRPASSKIHVTPTKKTSGAPEPCDPPCKYH